MKYRIFLSVFVLIVAFVNNAFSQKNLLSINDFKEPRGDWFEAGNAKLSGENEKLLEFISGDGSAFIFANQS